MAWWGAIAAAAGVGELLAQVIGRGTWAGESFEGLWAAPMVSYTVVLLTPRGEPAGATARWLLRALPVYVVVTVAFGYLLSR